MKRSATQDGVAPKRPREEARPYANLHPCFDDCHARFALEGAPILRLDREALRRLLSSDSVTRTWDCARGEAKLTARYNEFARCFEFHIFHSARPDAQARFVVEDRAETFAAGVRLAQHVVSQLTRMACLDAAG